MTRESITEFREMGYTNHLDQRLEPGDDVFFVVNGYNKSKDIRKGVFLGCRVKKEDPDRVSSLVVEYYTTWHSWNGGNLRKVEGMRKTNLFLNRAYKLDTNPWDIRL